MTFFFLYDVLLEQSYSPVMREADTLRYATWIIAETWSLQTPRLRCWTATKPWCIKARSVLSFVSLDVHWTLRTFSMRLREDIASQVINNAIIWSMNHLPVFFFFYILFFIYIISRLRFVRLPSVSQFTPWLCFLARNATTCDGRKPLMMLYSRYLKSGRCGSFTPHKERTFRVQKSRF